MPGGDYQVTLSTYAVNEPLVSNSTPTWLPVAPEGTTTLTTFHEPFNKFDEGWLRLPSL